MSAPTKILVIEDDSDDACFIQHYLQETSPLSVGFDVDCVDRLAGGLEALRSQAYDAVLLDLTLPDSQGIQTFLKLSAQGYNIPILILTGLEDVTLTMEALRLGAQDYLVKGTSDARILKRAIRYAIERKKLFNQVEGIINRAADGMVVVDREGLVRYMNPAARAVLDVAENDVLGKPFPYAFNERDPKLIKIPLKSKSNGSEARTIEMRVTEIEWRETPAYLASLRDISGVVRLEQLKAEIKERRRMDQLKDDLLNSVSHELRTPLTIVKGAIENIMDGFGGPMPPPMNKNIELAHRNIGRLAKLINNMLDLSRLESGKAKMNPGPTNLVELILEQVQQFGIPARDRKIFVEHDLQADIPPIQADGDMIAQILSNLLDNALRYAVKKVTVRAEVLKTAASESVSAGGKPFVAAIPGCKKIHITVSDDGPGIPREKMKDLFNKFIQVNRAMGGGGYKGTGLGLAICKEIIDLHHGEIWVSGRPSGQGAEFHFTLPEAAS